MTEKILYCASTLSHIKNFHLPYLKEFHKQGCEVWVAANRYEAILYADKVITLPFEKRLFSFRNIKAILAARQLIKRENFTIISTHTTLASFVIRMAVLFLHRKPKIFNTSHGYLFHENDGLKKWLYLLPEKVCAYVTDVLMVMNHEDYDIALKHKLYKYKLFYINGMGIDLTYFTPSSQEQRSAIRKEKNYLEKDFIFVYAAEFSIRKNQNLLIKAFANVFEGIPDAKLLLAGDGALMQECKELVKRLNMDEQIRFLGYVIDMKKLYAASDICVTTSQIEGLPFNVMEAMGCGLPVIASDIKGHRELVEQERTGFLFKSGNQEELEAKLKMVYKNAELCSKLGEEGKLKVHDFDIRRVKEEVLKVYENE